MSDIIQIAKDYACLCHWQVNHFYGDKPYSYHLQMVYDYGVKYIDLLINNRFRTEILSACWTHDLIEDTRQTYNNVKDKTNLLIADITYALTNEKGKNRKERANDKYYEGIRKQPGAVFVKLCDRLANVKHSVDTNSSMLNGYRKEHKDFVGHMSINEIGHPYPEMFNELNQLLGL